MTIRHTRTRTGIARAAVAGLATGVAALALAAPASAKVVVDQYIDVPNCTHPPGQPQVCVNMTGVSVQTQTPTVKVEYTDKGGCSDGIAHIFVDAREWGNNVVHPNQSDGGYEIPVSPGIHTYGVKMDGVPGGCNTGSLNAWGGNLHIEEL